MEPSSDFCDSCGKKGPIISCKECSRRYHKECVKNLESASGQELKKCSKCLIYGSKPIQIVEFLKTHDRDGKNRITPMIYYDRIAKIIKDSGAEKLPVLIISIAGVARSGKSFLLNLMIDRNIHHIECRNADWTTSKSHISGFNWAQSPTAITFGIWMWEKAIITQLNDGSKVAILYVDTQGTGDRVESTDPAIDTLIMYLSLEIATIQIHNINQVWRVEDTRIYEVCKLYGSLITRMANKPFNLLVLMHRNWQNDNKFGWRMNYYEKEVENVSKNPDSLKTLKGIKASFQSVDFVMLPFPGVKVTSSESSILSITDIDKTFLEKVEAFFDVLYNQKHSLQNCSERCKSGEDIIKIIKELKERVETEDMPPIGTPADHLADCLNSQAYTTAMMKFDEGVSKISADSRLVVYEKTIDEIISLAKETFEKTAVKQPDFLKAYRLYKKKLNDDLSKKKEILVKTEDLRLRQEEAEKLKMENLLRSEYEKILLLWEEKVQPFRVQDKESLIMYKLRLESLSSEMLDQFSRAAKEYSSDASYQSFHDQLKQALKLKEKVAMQQAESEQDHKKTKEQLDQQIVEQKKKDQEIQALQMKVANGEQLSTQQKEEFARLLNDKAEKDNVIKDLQKKVEESQKAINDELMKSKDEIKASLLTIQYLTDKVTKLTDTIKATNIQIAAQAEEYKNASSARGTQSESRMARFFHSIGDWFDSKLGKK